MQVNLWAGVFSLLGYVTKAVTWAKLGKKFGLQAFPPQPQCICNYRDGAKTHRRSSNHGVQKKSREWIKNARRYGNTRAQL